MSLTPSNNNFTNRGKDIKYLNKDFSAFKDNLIEFAKTYFPKTYSDFVLNKARKQGKDPLEVLGDENFTCSGLNSLSFTTLIDILMICIDCFLFSLLIN